MSGSIAMQSYRRHLMLPMVIVCFIQACSCHEWEMVYEHDTNGDVVTGTKQDLLSAYRDGADVKVLLHEWSYLTTTQAIRSVDGSELSAQALFHVSVSGSRFQDKAYFWFLDICTTGHIHIARYYVGSDASAGISTMSKAAQWFVRRSRDMMYAHNQDGATVSGSPSNVIKAVKSGSDIRILTSDSGSSLKIDNMEISQDEAEAVGQSVWVLSQSNIGSCTKFQGKDDYWVFSTWPLGKSRHVSRWNIGEHVYRNFTGQQKVSVRWFADSCWKMAFRHDENGIVQDGSLDLLRIAVELGSRVKVLVDGTLYEADLVVVRGGHVNAVLLGAVSKETTETFREDLTWNWMVATTTGTVANVNIDVGRYERRRVSTCKKEMTWFIDSQDWRRVLANDENGAVLWGSKEDLAAAVRNGFDVRYKITFSSLGSFIYQADNLSLKDDGNVSAMNVRSVALKARPGSEHELTFQDDLHWVFTLVLSTGRMDRSRWTVGDHVDRGHDNIAVKVEWFTSG